jgi:Skp family chaperone for outer membrane proteins
MGASLSKIDAIKESWRHVEDSIELWRADMLILVNVIKFWVKANKDVTKATQKGGPTAWLCEWTRISARAKIMMAKTATTESRDPRMTEFNDRAPRWNEIWTKMATAATKRATDEAEEYFRTRFNPDDMSFIEESATWVSKSAQKMNEAILQAVNMTIQWVTDITMEMYKDLNPSSHEKIIGRPMRQLHIACAKVQNYLQKSANSRNWEVKITKNSVADVNMITIRFNYYSTTLYNDYPPIEVAELIISYEPPRTLQPGDIDHILVEIEETSFEEVTDIPLFSKLYEAVCEVKLACWTLENTPLRG